MFCGPKKPVQINRNEFVAKGGNYCRMEFLRQLPYSVKVDGCCRERKVRGGSWCFTWATSGDSSTATYDSGVDANTTLVSMRIDRQINNVFSCDILNIWTRCLPPANVILRIDESIRSLICTSAFPILLRPRKYNIKCLHAIPIRFRI